MPLDQPLFSQKPPLEFPIYRTLVSLALLLSSLCEHVVLLSLPQIVWIIRRAVTCQKCTTLVCGRCYRRSHCCALACLGGGKRSRAPSVTIFDECESVGDEMQNE